MGVVGSREATSMKCMDDTWHSEPDQPLRRGFVDDPMMRELHAIREKHDQQTISRLESPRNGSLSLRTLVRIAHALGKEVRVQFV